MKQLVTNFYLLLHLSPAPQRGWKWALLWILALFPPFITLLVRLTPTPPSVTPLMQYSFLLQNLLCQYLLWLIPYLLICEFYQEEVRRGTIYYLWLSPMPRWHFLLVRVGVGWLKSVLLLSLALLPTALLLGVGGTPLALSLLAIVVGTFYFSAAFACLGVLFQRPMAAGLIYGFFIETLLSSLADVPAHKLPALFKVYSLVGIFDPRASQRELEEFWRVSSASLWLVGMALVWLAVAAFSLSRMEVRGRRQPL